jgi:hypothetical protein
VTTTRIRIRRGTKAQIEAVTDGRDGEPFYSTDTEEFFIADETGVPQLVSPPPPADFVGATSGDDGAAGLVPAPVAGDQVKFLRGDATWSALGGTRTTVSYTTASLAAGASESGSFTVPQVYSILKVTTNYPARVRLYLSADQQTADLSRPVTEDPTGNHGVVLETVTEAGMLSLDLSPAPISYTPDAGVTAYITVENLDTVSRVIDVDLGILESSLLVAGGAYAWSNITGVPVASASESGILQSADWSTFNGKQPASGLLSAIAALGLGLVSITGASAASVLPLGTANQVVGVNAAGNALENKSILGTSNQVTVSHAANSITLSLPQSIHSGASPTFTGMTLSGLTPGHLVYATTGGALIGSTNITTDGTSKLTIGYSTASTSSSTGALVVTGGLGVGGAAYIAGNFRVGVGTGAPEIGVDGAAGNNRLVKWFTGGSLRWSLQANTTAESGSDAGSHLTLTAYSDAGASLGNYILFSRAAGQSIYFYRPLILLNTDLTVGGACAIGSSTKTNAQYVTISTAAGYNRGFLIYTGSSIRWTFLADYTAETGSDAGTNFALWAHNDAGTYVDSPIAVTRASGGTVTIGGTTNRPLSLDGTGVITIAAGKNFVLNTTTGTKIGTGTTQKLGFWNATPVVQPAAQADASGGSVIDTEARAALNGLLAKLRTIGLIAT